MARIREPALAIWQATKCLAELQVRIAAPDVCKILAEAEQTLLGLMLNLLQRAALSEPVSSPASQESVYLDSPVNVPLAQ